MDVHLPGMSGIDLRQRLHAAHGAPPVIVTTGRHGRVIRERAEGNGCAGFFRKPVDRQAVLATVNAIATQSAA